MSPLLQLEMGISERSTQSAGFEAASCAHLLKQKSQEGSADFLALVYYKSYYSRKRSLGSTPTFLLSKRIREQLNFDAGRDALI